MLVNIVLETMLVVIAGVVAGVAVNDLVTRLPAALERSWRAEALHILELEAVVQHRSQPERLVSARMVAIVAGCTCISALVVWHIGFNWTAAAVLLCSWALLALALIDAEHLLLPDDLVIPVLWLGLLVNSQGVVTDLQNAVLGAASGYLSLWAVHQVSRLVTGRGGIGYGDFKLFALLGAWGGWQLLPLILFGAVLSGIAWWALQSVRTSADLRRERPFGPHLALAGGIGILSSASTYWPQISMW
ncbi:prepilin peptidase [Pseudomonas sp. MWU12-2115]|uniref:prepilin peptidase n=1 Tax=unclassified Pseudomonas TaxID=196821 RepID=UPI000CD55CAA|nr:A24 family peptidase [Pseudomonas sp. MWU12-2020]RBB97322.1 prepilin peptidase [Pseudomonas sp. MWU12-2115]